MGIFTKIRSKYRVSNIVCNGTFENNSENSVHVLWGTYDVGGGVITTTAMSLEKYRLS